MRKNGMQLGAMLMTMLFASVVGAQGINDKIKNPTGKPGDAIKEMKTKGNAGPGFVQGDFISGLEDKLTEKFGEKKGGMFFDNMKSSGATSKDTTDLMNGKSSKKDLKELFGCSSGDAKKIEGLVDEQVEDKNKKMFFGVIIIILVEDMGMDSSGDFMQQVAGGGNEINPDDFEKLMNGSFSTKIMAVIFGFGHKSDQKTMQSACNQAAGSAMMQHPLAGSMSFGQKQGGSFDPSQFMKGGEGMPGFGEGFEDGMSGGMPFPSELPPMPFMGENMGEFFESCKPPSNAAEEKKFKEKGKEKKDEGEE